MTNKIEAGSLVQFDYEMWVGDSPHVADTSIETVAKEHGIFREGRPYGPVTSILGIGNIIPGLDRHIRENGEVGVALQATVPPEDAYGSRDPAGIKDVPMAKFKAAKAEPKVGATVTIDGRKGAIVRVAGGRVRVDFNHELAGKTLRYRYTLAGIFNDEHDFAAKLCAAALGPCAVQTSEQSITVEVMPAVRSDQNLFQRKFMLADQIQRRFKKDVVFQETFPLAPTPPAPAAPA